VNVKWFYLHLYSIALRTVLFSALNVAFVARELLLKSPTRSLLNYQDHILIVLYAYLKKHEQKYQKLCLKKKTTFSYTCIDMAVNLQNLQLVKIEPLYSRGYIC